MHRLVTIVFLLICWATSTAQDSLEWKCVSTFTLPQEGVWATDIQGNLFGSSNGNLIKWDVNGAQQFSQSLKQTGTISSISPVNTMKLLVFSEDQQTVCFLDNTLSFAEGCIDLDGFGVAYATHVAASGQADRFWVLDQVNNTLSLINWNTKERIVDLVNLNGIIGPGKPLKLMERSNYLFYADDKGVFQFDRFGTLIASWPHKNAQDVEVTDRLIVVLSNNQLTCLDREKGYLWKATLPQIDTDGLYISGSYIYFKRKNSVEKYTYFIQE